MTKQQYAIESLASDLRRVALGLDRGSTVMGAKFFDEAIKRIEEIKIDDLPSYIVKIINQISKISLSKKSSRVPEDCLMYAQLLQNYAQS